MTQEEAYIQGFIDKCAEYGITKEAGLPRFLKTLGKGTDDMKLHGAFDAVSDDTDKARAILAMLDKNKFGKNVPIALENVGSDFALMQRDRGEAAKGHLEALLAKIIDR
jgi:hypothetical protein